MPVQPVQDIFGLSRLAQSIRQGRFDKRQQDIEGQQATTRDLQQQGLRLGIQEKQQGISDLAAGRKSQADLQTAISTSEPGQSKTLTAINFLKNVNPDAAQELITKTMENAGKMAKFNAQGAIDFVNKELGVNWKLDKEDTETITIDQGDKKSIVNKLTGELIKEFPKAQVLTPQQKAFSLLSPDEQKATFFKSGQTIEMTKDGGFKITSGGTSIPQQKFEEKQAEKAKKEEIRIIKAIAGSNNIIDVLDGAIPNIGLTTTGMGSILKLIPGTSASDLEGDLDTITAKMAFTALKDMRDASPTGGALGQVSEIELILLGATIRSLKQRQSPEKLRSNLSKIRKLFVNAKNRLDVADSFRKKGMDPNNLTEEQLRTETETGTKIVIPNHPVHGDITDDDIKETMADTGLPEEEVLKALGAK